MINDQGYTVDVPTAPNQVKLFIMEVLDETEKLGISSGDTKKVTLENIAKDWNLSCPVCGLSDDGDETWCETCKSKRTVKHPAAIRSQLILDSRKAQKEIELYDKLLAAGRLHASFKVIGTLSSRMSGGDGLNPQAIKKTDDVKGQFILQWPGYILAGGDFDAFEITIAEAVYNDPALRKDLLTCEACKSDMVFNKEKVEYVCSACGSTKGQKIHALFGVCCFPPLTYDEVKATDGTDDDKYTRSKSAIFTKIYGGGAESMIKKLGVTLEAATEACRVFDRKYAGVGRAQERVDEMFGSMSQPDGRGSAISWKEPADRIETLLVLLDSLPLRI